MIPLKLSQIKINADVSSPHEAIELAGNLLVKSGSVTEKYVQAMKNSYDELGPYIVLAPHIAIPHARPEDGVIEQCISVVRLATSIKFGHPENDEVKLVMAFGGVDKDFHIKMLRSLSEVLTDQEKLNVLMNSENEEEILKVMTN